MKLFGYLCISAVGMVAGFAIACMVLPIPALPPVPAPVYQVGGSECYMLSGFADEANNGVRCAPTVITLSSKCAPELVKRHRRKAHDVPLFVTRGSRTDIPLRSDGGWRPGQHIEQLSEPGILCSAFIGKEQLQWPSSDGNCSIHDKAFPQPKPQ